MPTDTCAPNTNILTQDDLDRIYLGSGDMPPLRGKRRQKLWLRKILSLLFPLSHDNFWESFTRTRMVSRLSPR